MSRHLRPLDRLLLTTLIGMPLSLPLSACGDDGSSGVAMLPPPPQTPTPSPTPTPTPGPTDLAQGTVIVQPTADFIATPGSLSVQRSWLQSPATRPGATDVLGTLLINPQTSGVAAISRSVAPGEFVMTVSNTSWGGFSYTLGAPAGLLAAGLTTVSVVSPQTNWDINLPPSNSYRYPSYGDDTQYFGQRLTASAKGPDGTERQFLQYDFTRATARANQVMAGDIQLQASLTYDAGYSYVAMGEWNLPVVLNGNVTSATNFGDLLFVNGDRTPASGIPVSGTATYDARTLLLRSSSGELGIPFALTADFGLRTIGARIDQDFKNYGDDDPIQGIHVGGSAPFSNDGSFNIPLTGSVNYSYQNQALLPPSEPAIGGMNGAFFGPNAEQIGGTFSIQRTQDQSPLYRDAFVGQQRPH